MRKVLHFRKKLESFGFEFFVGDGKIGVGLHIYGRGHQVLSTNPTSELFWLKWFGL